MVGTPGGTALATTVDEALTILETRFESVGAGVANGRYALWLGSGISRDRLPNLHLLVRKVVEFLHGRLTGDPSDEPYRRALMEALRRGLRENEARLVDVNAPLDTWPGLENLLNGLVGHYSELLGIQVQGQDPDYLLWDAVDVRATYGLGHPPDCEHICVAMLALEGAVADVATPNWDGLIEAAFAELGIPQADALKLVVLDEDFREPQRSLTLIKFHGCAVRATEDPGRYRSSLIATQTQIIGWMTGDAYRVMRDRLIQLATDKPTLIIGLSAQDANIQNIFASAKNAMQWDWPGDPPPQVVADGRLGDDHLNILRVMFGDQRAGEIESDALVPAYAKTFLPALVISTLTRKLHAYLAEADAPSLPEADREQLATGLGELAHRIARTAEPDQLVFIQRVAAGQGRALHLLQTGREPDAAGMAGFQPLGGLPTDRVGSDSGLPTNGLRELAAALALLGRGTAAAKWTLTGDKLGTPGAAPLQVTSAVGTSLIFFAANGQAATQLISEGLLDPDDPAAVIIHSTEPVQQAKRSPRSSYGRTGRAARREVDMCEMLKNTTQLDELEERFRQEACF